MLRFCDKEVYKICVYDDCSRWEEYRGRITFHSLIQHVDMYDAMQMVVMN